MTIKDYFQIFLFLGILALLTKPLGIYFVRVFDKEPLFLSRFLGPIEKFLYRKVGVNHEEDQTWPKYSIHLLVFSAVTMIFTYGILRIQQILPLNSQGFGTIAPHLAFNTAVSFATNTNWQSYAGESTMSYFSQMVALTLQNFISAAVGIAASVAMVRGLTQKKGQGIGNFWSDLIRCILYILLPFCVILATFYMSQGVIQNFLPYQQVSTLEGSKQLIAQGPVASQAAIKLLGSNGGGFFNANSAHPYENPTPLSNFVQYLSILLIPAGLIYLLGKKSGNLRHGWAIWAAVAVVFLVGAILVPHLEYSGNPIFQQLGCSTNSNMEGKETRFGIFSSAFFSSVTTDSSCGATNSALDSFTPLGGLVTIVNMTLGEVIFGGAGSGLYGLMMYIILTVFIAGLMIGRTPEYLGKRVEARDLKYIMLALIMVPLLSLGFSAIASISPSGIAGLGNPGSHGFSELLYSYSSATANNGSAFAGLNASSPFWTLTLAFAMFFGRYFMLIPMLAFAGSMTKKKVHPQNEGTFPVDNLLFALLLIGIIVLVGALTFFPALSLGPIAEHIRMIGGGKG